MLTGKSRDLEEMTQTLKTNTEQVKNLYFDCMLSLPHSLYLSSSFFIFHFSCSLCLWVFLSLSSSFFISCSQGLSLSLYLGLYVSYFLYLCFFLSLSSFLYSYLAYQVFPSLSFSSQFYISFTLQIFKRTVAWSPPKSLKV